LAGVSVVKTWYPAAGPDERKRRTTWGSAYNQVYEAYELGIY
jgi:hypothetical protein